MQIQKNQNSNTKTIKQLKCRYKNHQNKNTKTIRMQMQRQSECKYKNKTNHLFAKKTCFMHQATAI